MAAIALANTAGLLHYTTRQTQAAAGLREIVTIVVRREAPADYAAVHAINAAAFPTPAEADLVDRLRDEAAPLVSLVAEEEGVVLGHILFSPVALDGSEDIDIRGLAPMAVTPGRQNDGIGSALVRAGLAQCIDEGAAAAVVLGHPHYYPRFGFRPSVEFGIDSDYEVPAEIFMAQALVAGALDGRKGRVHYHPAFANL